MNAIPTSAAPTRSVQTHPVHTPVSALLVTNLVKMERIAQVWLGYASTFFQACLVLKSNSSELSVYEFVFSGDTNTGVLPLFLNDDFTPPMYNCYRSHGFTYIILPSRGH